MAEALPIPPLCLAGRVPPTNSILQFDATTAHVDLTLWPDFHNGVAAALRVGPAAEHASSQESGGQTSRLAKRSKITRNWIMYNRTASVGKLGGDAAHAGTDCKNFFVLTALPVTYQSLASILQASCSGWDFGVISPTSLFLIPTTTWCRATSPPRWPC